MANFGRSAADGGPSALRQREACPSVWCEIGGQTITESRSAPKDSARLISVFPRAEAAAHGLDATSLCTTRGDTTSRPGSVSPKRLNPRKTCGPPCAKTNAVLFANAISVINDLSAAQKRGLLKRQLKTYLRPELLVLDEIGYLPIDQHGADLLFQVISQRYERGSIVLTTNKPFKQWPSIFNNDSTIASAVLDRLLHHAQTIVIEGSSYRMKDRENQ